MFLLAAIVLASLVTGTHQIAIPPVSAYRAGNCSINAYVNCDSLANCIDSPDVPQQYTCQCRDNATGDGFKTTSGGTGCKLAFKPCATNKDCPQYGNCSSDYKCVCNKGFEGDGFTCTDINECPSPLCDPNAYCLNNPGSFKCVCNVTRNYVGDGFTCTFKCGSNNDCDAPRAVCSDENKCVCIKGYEGDGRKCNDTNECALRTTNNCNTNANCINTVGSFKCECKNGYTGNGINCTALPKNCKEIPNFVNGNKYKIDPDFTGPGNAFTVICDKINGIIVTKLPATGPFPMATPNVTGTLDIKYEPLPVDIIPLLETSVFCYQDISFSCNARFALLPGTKWTDAYGNSYSTWGSTVDGQCACGELGMCNSPTSPCNCDGSQAGTETDAGRIVDKTRLPVTSLIFTSAAVNKGRVDIQPLICADKPVGIPKDCHDAKFFYGVKKNAIMYIKPDVNGPLLPSLVKCDMETYFHAGVTVIPTSTPVLTPTTVNGSTVIYPIDLPRITALITGSKFCMQYIEFVCKSSKLMEGGGYVTVSSAQRRLNYFPGANGVQNSCGCGATLSCDSPTVKCNCDIGDSVERKDFGLIINKTDLPVVSVTAEIGQYKSGTYKISPLRCSGIQFAIQPNCDKARADGTKESQTMFIDADGPALSAAGNTEPFLAYCNMTNSPPQGQTYINHNSMKPKPIFEWLWSIQYLTVSKEQIEALKTRSTMCYQSITVGCKNVNIRSSSGTITFKGPSQIPVNLTDFLQSCGPNGTDCQCNGNVDGYDTGIITDIKNLPINSLDFSKVMSQYTDSGFTVTLGPLICTEVFQSCATLQAFLLSNRTAYGETYRVDNIVTIDPDGQGPVAPFGVQCSLYSTTVILRPPNVTLQTDPNNPNPVSQCYDISYTNGNGDSISAAQIAALVKASGKCRQDLQLECKNAPATGNVNFTTCSGVPQKGWAGSFGEDKCACGVIGQCAGGPNAKCNCDMNDGATRTDTGTIINPESLPVCQICFNITPKPGSAGKPPPLSSLKYKLGELVCDGGQGTQKNCQEARNSYGTSVKSPYETSIAFNTEPPTPVACKLLPYPYLGIMAVKASNPVINYTMDVVITYVSFNISIIYKIMSQSEYCSQNLYLFCASDASLKLGGSYGIYNYKGEIFYEWTQIPDSNTVINDTCNKYKDLCTKCGRPKGFLLSKQEILPISRISLAGSGATMVVGDVECLDIKKTCHEVMFTPNRKTGFVSGNRYVLDSDGSGIRAPYTATCEFNDVDNVGTTVIPTNTSVTGPQHVVYVDGKDPFELPIIYDGANPDQMNTLAMISDFCWQGFKFECSYSPVHTANQTKTFYRLYNGDRVTSLGTGEDVAFNGCACGKTGTCITGYSCNCDAVGRMGVDQGAVTNTNSLPITSVSIGGQTKGTSSADVTVTNLRCSPKPLDPPKDCDEALKRKSKYQVDYAYSSEYLINPDPTKVRPFMVRCDFDLSPGNGVTIVKPTVPPTTPLIPSPDNPFNVPYYGPTDAQIEAIVAVSQYCYQPVKYDCFGSTFLSEGTYWLTIGSREKRLYWGGGEIGADGRGVCACGKQQSCGGLDSATAQRARRCNCDAGDNVTRSDAGILDIKENLPLSKIWTSRLAKFNGVNITVGDLMCSQTPLTFNECNLGFHDCHPMARCVDEVDGYRCICKDGWNAKGIPPLPRNPRANGRECIDDDECASEPCPYSAVCHNTPGDFYCECNDGYRQTGKTACEDVDECADPSLNNCDQHARCENLDGSYRCICDRGYRGDGVTCIPVGECACFGDTHCISYDNRWLHFQELCEYTMSQDGCQGGAEPTYRVLIQQWQKNNTLPGHYGWVKAVRILVFGKEIIFEQGNRILVDGIAVKQYFDKHLLSVISTLNQVVLQTVTGLEVTFDGKDSVKVTVPEGSSNQVCGLCGNYNRNPTDDWTIGPACPAKQGQTTDNENLFGRSWTVLQDSVVTCNVDCSDTPTPPDTCNIPMAIVEKECGKLMNLNTSPFAACLKMKNIIDVVELTKSCKIDLCHFEDSLDAAVCRFAQTMSVDCAEKEKVEIKNWKLGVPECGHTTCPNNMIFKDCGPAEPPTCISKPVESDLTRVNNSLACIEGCFCADDLVMEGDKCIKPEQCGCFYNNSYMATNDIIILTDCSYEVQCLGKNQTVQYPVQCKENEKCSTQGGVTGCYCKEGYTMKPGDTKCEPDSCAGVVCSIPNMECVDGTCQCKMGFIGDCNQCEDIDECATGLDDCNMVGQTCINLQGSYKCGCKEGFVISGAICKDIDECEYGIANCGDHSECVNTPGAFLCECCAGYKKDPSGSCIRDTTQAIASNGKCCACQGERCNDTGKVCGSDGVTYSSYRSLSIAACKAGNTTDLKVEYKGACQSSCSSVICEKQYSNCTVENGKPKCGCPKCENSTSSYSDETVCATNKITYTSICHMKQATCEAEIETTVEVEFQGRPCPGKGTPTTGPWSDWGDCSEACKQGTRNRTRDVYVPNPDKKIHDIEFIPCYNSCPNGPCKQDTCLEPGQVCVADSNNNPSCQCPTCELFDSQPICTRVTNVIKTYDNECELEKAICDLKTNDYEILEPRACEDKPVKCGLVRDYRIETVEGCTADRHINFGSCYGGCDDEAELCCFGNEKGTAKAIMYCPNGTHFERTFETVIGCNCLPKPAPPPAEEQIAN